MQFLDIHHEDAYAIIIEKGQDDTSRPFFLYG